jgi:hypothetical protein
MWLTYSSDANFLRHAKAEGVGHRVAVGHGLLEGLGVTALVVHSAQS